MTEEAGPTFLIVGAARSGTTVLARALARHEQVFLTDPKEPHFLAFAGMDVHFRGPGDDQTVNRVARTCESDWRALFAAGMDRPHRGDGSVSTLYYSARAADNIARYCPDVRMIVLLREPVARAFSAYSYLVGRGFETETFEVGLEREPERMEAGWHHMWHYWHMGCYADQLRCLFDRFGRDRVLVQEYDELVATPAPVLDRCFAFLGIEEGSVRDLGPTVNAGGSPRSRTLSRGVAWLSGNRALRAAVRRVVPYEWRERVRGANLRTAVLDDDVRSRLADRYALQNHDLAGLLADDAPSWAA